MVDFLAFRFLNYMNNNINSCINILCRRHLFHRQIVHWTRVILLADTLGIWQMSDCMKGMNTKILVMMEVPAVAVAAPVTVTMNK